MKRPFFFLFLYEETIKKKKKERKSNYTNYDIPSTKKMKTCLRSHERNIRRTIQNGLFLQFTKENVKVKRQWNYPILVASNNFDDTVTHARYRNPTHLYNSLSFFPHRPLPTKFFYHCSSIFNSIKFRPLSPMPL